MCGRWRAARTASACGRRRRSSRLSAAVAETLLWHLRILAGLAAGAGAGLMRALAAWFELANIDARLAALAGDGARASAVRARGAGHRLEQDRARRALSRRWRRSLAGSAWGDPGGQLAGGAGARVARGMGAPGAGGGARTPPTGWQAPGRCWWRVSCSSPADREHAAQLRRLPGIGREALGAGSLDELRARCPRARRGRWRR